MSELAKRWAVALVGIPTVIGLLYAGGWTLAIPLAALAAMGAHELFRIAEATGDRPFVALGGAAAAALVLLSEWRPRFDDLGPWAMGLLVGLMGLTVVGDVVARAPRQTPLEGAAVTSFGVLYVALPLGFVPMLHALPTELGWGATPPSRWVGFSVVALPLACAWIGDSVAFFAGTAWGGAKLAPAISPAKTWVGAWAGLAGSALAAVGWYLLAARPLPGLPLPGAWAAAGAGVLLGGAAQVGDLAESLLKRQAGVKDSGRLFPGHGGVLDRLDALTLTLPLSYAILLFAEVTA